MITLPDSGDDTPLLRTDYSDDDLWRGLLADIAIPTAEGFLAYVAIVQDAELDGISDDEVRRLPATGERPLLVLVADSRTLREPDHPILVVDTFGHDRPSFRVNARCLWAVQNNLSLANMDWEEFSDNVDADGVYRC